MSLARYLSDLAGTLRSSFRIGVNKLENVTGTLTSRTNAGVDAPFAASAQQLKGATSGTATLQPAAVTTDYTVTLPAAQGAVNQTLRNNGSGVLTWETFDPALNGVKAEDQVIVAGSTSPVTIVVLPAGATIQKVIVEVETIFDGAPSLSVGVTGTAAKYMAATDMDLAVAAIYEVEPMIEESLSVSPIVTYAAGGATVGQARVTVQWALPG